jgi:hypothetical protein
MAETNKRQQKKRESSIAWCSAHVAVL